MPKIVIFCEDFGHENVIKAIICKMDKSVQVLPLSNRGGKGKALTELERYLKQVKANQVPTPPDVIVAAIDANCKGYHEKNGRLMKKYPKDYVI